MLKDIHIVLIMIVFVLSPGFTGLFSDLRMTGMQVADQGNALPVQQVCIDSDQGKQYYIQGAARFQNDRQADSCQGVRLKEFFCTAQGIQFEYFSCSNGCKDGACKKPAVYASPTAPQHVYAEASPENKEPSSMEFAGSNTPSLTVDTSSGTTVVSTAQPVFHIDEAQQRRDAQQQQAREQEEQKRKDAEKQNCLQRCDTRFDQCLHACGHNPFMIPFCVADCSRTGENCKRRC